MMKLKIGIMLLIAVLVGTGAAVAQNIDAEWARWDSTLTFQAGSEQIVINEVQEFNIFQGPVRFGVRAWQDPVEILDVFVVAEGQRPVQLQQSNTDEPGTYTLEPTATETVLQYNLPEPAESGDNFVVQINYVTQANAEGLLDWHIVPADHGFPIQSSTAVLNFVGATPPDEGLVRVIAGNATATTSGNQIVLESGPLAADEPFQIQVPFGEGVGAAGGSGSSNQPVQPVATVPSGGVQTVPSQPESDTGFNIDLSTILLVLCGIGLLVLFGGGSLLRSLLGGFLGGGTSGGLFPRSGGGGIFPRTGGGTSRPVNPTSGGSTSRGFRPSSRQNRSLPTVRSSKKGTGGRAGLG